MINKFPNFVYNNKNCPIEKKRMVRILNKIFFYILKKKTKQILTHMFMFIKKSNQILMIFE